MRAASKKHGNWLSRLPGQRRKNSMQMGYRSFSQARHSDRSSTSMLQQARGTELIVKPAGSRKKLKASSWQPGGSKTTHVNNETRRDKKLTKNNCDFGRTRFEKRRVGWAKPKRGKLEGTPPKSWVKNASGIKCEDGNEHSSDEGMRLMVGARKSDGRR
ncbi:hypothetical protein JVT61DRAFT_12574 [Boletus reticuloceps]|uniref:Uncharacterized protein n=1 Tax=Boletus reticuloceps TaxID=495285 RepID=A0A8I2YDK0_9AGAM|nr:hypothetical protein JVT61DRAFT_12574 [Boletus reticuloceps]